MQTDGRGLTPVPEALAVTVHRDWSEARAVWPATGDPDYAATPFQSRAWLDAWYATAGQAPGVEPLILSVHAASGAAPLALLPLIRRRAQRLATIEFADLGLTDYNAPVLHRGIFWDGAAAGRLCRAVRSAVAPADLAVFAKMPTTVLGTTNPFALLPSARPSTLKGNIVVMTDGWDAWLKSLERTFRKELGRSLRVFERHPGARFERVTDPARAAHVLAGLETLQAGRIAGLGLDYVLDEERNAALYRRLVADQLGTGRAVLTALTCGDEVVAALLGIADDATYCMVRLGAAGGDWRTVSPGRLVIERTMHALFQDGRRRFDFTTGEYPYKRRLGVAPVPLVEVADAMSWRGLPAVAAAGARAFVRTRPALRRLLRRTEAAGRGE